MNDFATKLREAFEFAGNTFATFGPYLLVGGFVLAIAFGARESRTQRRSKEEFGKMLENALASDGPHVNLEYVRILVRSWGRQNTYERVVVAELLEDLISHLSAGSAPESETKIQKVIALLAQERAEEPYDALPDEERRLLRAIAESLTAQSPDATLSILKELESVLGVRHKSYGKLLMQNKWSIPLAVVGIILSVVFGLPAVMWK